MDAAEGMSNRLVWICIVVLMGSLFSYPQSTAPTELSSSAVLFSGDGGNQTDDCPEVNGTSSIDRNGCLDTDGDGYSDPDSIWNLSMGADAFPLRADAWSDLDGDQFADQPNLCLLYTSPSPRDRQKSRMPSSA